MTQLKVKNFTKLVVSFFNLVSSYTSIIINLALLFIAVGANAQLNISENANVTIDSNATFFSKCAEIHINSEIINKGTIVFENTKTLYLSKKDFANNITFLNADSLQIFTPLKYNTNTIVENNNNKNNNNKNNNNKKITIHSNKTSSQQLKTTITDANPFHNSLTIISELNKIAIITVTTTYKGKIYNTFPYYLLAQSHLLYNYKIQKNIKIIVDSYERDTATNAITKYSIARPPPSQFI